MVRSIALVACLVVSLGSASPSIAAVAPAPTPAPSAAPSGAASAAPSAAAVSPTADGSASPAPSASPSASSSPIDLARSRIETMLRTGRSDPAWFSATFLAQIPAAKVDEVVASLTSALGAFRSVEFAQTKFVARFAKGTDDVLIHLDAQSKIDGLLFRPPVSAAASLDEGLEALRPSSGTLSYVVTEEGRPVRAALDASAPLAVGSAFKVAVLNALTDEVSAGRLRWTDVAPLRREWKSLPSGVLQTWPDGTPVTLATLAAEMISISDNTAADALVRIVGPKALDRYAGANRPFLTTREAFTLKSTLGRRLRSEYREALTPDAREKILRAVDALPLPNADQYLATPDLAVEWRYSVRDVCRMLTRVSSLPVTSINPGVADASAFRRVAYKGGSDVGALNLTTVATTKRGTTVCFSVTVNDSTRAVDESRLEAAYGGVLRFLESD